MKFITEEECWGCKQDRGILLHMLWECKILREFWESILLVARKLSTFEIPESAAFFLIHHNDIPSVKYKNTVLPLILDTAKLSVTMTWKSDRAPKMKDWLDRILEVKRLKKKLAYGKMEGL